MPTLLEDKNVLKTAVVTKSLENVKTLIGFGFHLGVDLAITLATTYKLVDIVRLLLFWQVEIRTYSNFPRSSNPRLARYPNKLLWKQLELQHITSRLLHDAQSAVNMAVETLMEMSQELNFKENDLPGARREVR